MRFTLFVLTVVLLTLSGLAAHVFFGEKGADPERVEMLAHLEKIEAGARAARSGDPNAQFWLARLYRYGPEKTRNHPRALQLFRKAAEQGHVRAQYELGAMYAAGLGTKQSFHRAAEWFLLSANLGRDRDAEFALGDLSFKGRGVAHSYGTAISWYRKAARQLGVDFGEMVHVGDRDHNDVKGPQALGMKAVLFTAKRDADRATTSADAVCERHADLPAVIDRLAG